MQEKVLRVLLIEDNPADIRLIREMLRESRPMQFTIQSVTELNQIKKLSDYEFDVVLLDLGFDDISGVETYGYANAYFPYTPIIVLTGLSDEQLAFQVVKLGAQDYLLKDAIDAKTLTRSIRYAIERKKSEVQKDEFLGFASHELKTPVTSIKAYVQLMELYATNKREDAKSILPFIKKVDSQVDKLTKLINDLLDVTKVQSGKLQFNFENFEINEIIDEVIDTMQLTTSKHEIIKEGSTHSSIYGDKERTSQVLINLLSNAIKYSPDADKIIVTVKNGGRKVQIAVRDFGTGIKQDDQKKVFERFYRANDKTAHTDTYPGLGLGLYIAAEITKRQNGKIFLSSNEGEGATFFVEFPTIESAKKQEEMI